MEKCGIRIKMTSYCKRCGKELLEFKGFILLNAYCYECWEIKNKKEGEENGKKET